MHLKDIIIQNIQKNHIHIGRTFDIYIIKSATIKSATLVLLSKVGLGRTFDRSRFWRVFAMLLQKTSIWLKTFCNEE